MGIRSVASWALGIGAILAVTAGALALASTLRVPDQPGQPLGVDPVSIVSPTAPPSSPTPVAVAEPDDNGDGSGSSDSSESSGSSDDTVIEVPAPDPVVVEDSGDDHGGNSGNSGPGGGDSGSGGHGSN